MTRDANMGCTALSFTKGLPHGIVVKPLEFKKCRAP